MVWIHKKSLIKKCKELSGHFIKLGIEFRQLSLSLEQNKPTPNIKEFIEKRVKVFCEVKE